ncbi:MAG: DUF5686 family protein, partial [Bacteroidota bacterium]
MQTSPAYLDSMDAVSNKFKGIQILTGYAHRNSITNRYWSLAGPLTNLQFNTVEGWNLTLSGEYKKTYGEEDDREWKVEPAIRYGFSNRHVNPRIAFTYKYDTRNQGLFNVEAGSEVNQFNPSNPVSPTVNNFYSLFAQKNYLKIYQQRFLSVSHRSEITNGLMLGVKAGYYFRIPLSNTTDFSFDPDNLPYTVNNPILPSGDTISFEENSAWIITLKARIRFGQKFISRPEARYIVGSKWPTLRIEYTKAVPLGEGSMDFDKIKFTIDDEWDLGLFGDFRFKVGSGMFLNRSRFEFMDINHFNGNKTFFSNFRIDDFMGLDYYAYSTTEPFAEFHAEQHFKGLLLNKIPLLKKLRLDEVLTLHAVAVNGDA